MDFWNGPFENEFFMNSSVAYQQVYSMFIDDKKFLDYKPETQYQFSIDILLNKERRKCFEGVENMMEMKKAHFFHFERWDKSLVTKYFIEAVFILFSCFISFSLITEALGFEIQAQTYEDKISQKESILNSTTDSSVIAQLNSEIVLDKNKAEEFSKRAYHGYNDAIWVNWIL